MDWKARMGFFLSREGRQRTTEILRKKKESFLRWGWLLLVETRRSIHRHGAMILASALAYKSLLALVPMLAISLAFVAMLEPSNGPGEEGISYTESFIAVIKDKVPDSAGMQELIDAIRRFASNARAIAGIGFIFLFVTAYSLLSSAENAFNIIWQVTERRAVLQRLTSYLATLIVVPILMSLSVYCTARIASVTEQVVQVVGAAGVLPLPSMEKGGQGATQPVEGGVSLPDKPLPSTSESQGESSTSPSSSPEDQETSQEAVRSLQDLPSLRASPPSPIVVRKRQHPIVAVVLALFSIFSTCLALTCLYYFLPFTKVHLRAAVAGGIVAGVALDVIKIGFRYFAAYKGQALASIYGSLLAVPLGLIWLWLIWVIVLFGAELAFTIQNFRDLAARAEIERSGISSRIYLGVRTVLRACLYFHRGENPLDLAERVAEELQTPPYLIREIIATLCRKEILRRVIPGEDAYLPAKDIAELTVGEVVRALQPEGFSVPSLPDSPLHQFLAQLFRQAHEAEAAILDKPTFAELVRLVYRREVAADRDPLTELVSL